MKLRLTAIIITVLGCTASISAQTDRNETLTMADHNGWEYEVKAGVNIGGATPLPLPREIRKINSFNPRFNGTIEATVTKWLGKEKKWGIATGLKFEEKAMRTGANVKNYHTEIINDGSRVAGYWTGHVRTDYNETFLTIPITANYRFNDRWKVRAGLFGALKLDGEFSGVVSDGYLRNGTPVGEKLEFTDGKTSTYDFSSNLRHLEWGAQIGGTWRAFKHFTVNADLTWAFNGIFEKDFKTISFGLYPVYMNVGFGYRF